MMLNALACERRKALHLTINAEDDSGLIAELQGTDAKALHGRTRLHMTEFALVAAYSLGPIRRQRKALNRASRHLVDGGVC